jgi:hypothetical protein
MDVRISRILTDSHGIFTDIRRKIRENPVRIREIRTLYLCGEKEESSIFATKRSKEWIQTVVHLGVNPVMDGSPHSLQTFVEIPNSSESGKACIIMMVRKGCCFSKKNFFTVLNR